MGGEREADFEIKYWLVGLGRYYALPLTVGLSAYIFRVFIDILCPSPRTTEWDYELGDGCRSISNFLVDIYQLLLLITMVYVIYKTNGAWNRLKDIFGFVRHAAADEGGRARLAAEGAAMLAQSTQRMKTGLKTE